MLVTRASHFPRVLGMRTGWDSVACETHRLMCMVCGALPGTTRLDEDMREPVVLARGEGGGAGRALKGLPPAGLEGTFEIARSLPHGHVAAVLGTIRELGLKELMRRAELERRLGHANDRYLRLYTNPTVVVASYVEDL